VETNWTTGHTLILFCANKNSFAKFDLKLRSSTYLENGGTQNWTRIELAAYRLV